MKKNWTLIEILFRIQLDLDFSIYTLNNSFGTKLKIIRDMWYKIENSIKI